MPLPANDSLACLLCSKRSGANSSIKDAQVANDVTAFFKKDPHPGINNRQGVFPPLGLAECRYKLTLRGKERTF